MLLNENLASKDNLARVEASLKVDLARMDVKTTQVEAKIAQVEANLKANLARVEAKISQSKSDLIKWVVGIVLGVATVQTMLMVSLFA